MCFACVSNNYFYCARNDKCSENSKCKGTKFDSSKPCEAEKACDFGHSGIGFLGESKDLMGGLGSIGEASFNVTNTDPCYI